MNVKSILEISLGFTVSACLMTACKTTDIPPTAQTKSSLDNAVFKQMVNAAYDADEYDDRETKFTALLARDDLTQNQRAETYWYRGTIRGVYVNDGPYASPYCSVEDLEIMLTMDPDHPKKGAALKNITYQESRYQYFKQPVSCGN